MPLHPKMAFLFIVVPIGVMIPLCCAGWLAFGEGATHVPGSCLVACHLSPWPRTLVAISNQQHYPCMNTSGQNEVNGINIALVSLIPCDYCLKSFPI